MTTAQATNTGVTWVGLLLRSVYLSVATALLFSAVNSYVRVPTNLRHHVAEALAWQLIILTFPAGLVLTALIIGGLALLDLLTGIILPGGPWEMIGTWVLFTAAGYLQWFGYGSMMRWVRRRRAASADRTLTLRLPPEKAG